MSNYQTINEHIEQAMLWSERLPYYPGLVGWRTTCRVLAEEVVRLRREIAFYSNTNTYCLPVEYLTARAEDALYHPSPGMAICRECGFEDDLEKSIHPCDNCGSKNWRVEHPSPGSE